MKSVVFAVVIAVAVAAPQYGYPTPKTTPGPYTEPPKNYLGPDNRDAGATEEAKEIVQILKDERVNNEDGSYTVDVETENGIKSSENGAPGTNGTIVKSGQFSFTAPDGTVLEFKYIADENGYQAESAAIPIAPEFPHPIPEFVLEQIKFAQEEEARAAAEAKAAARVPSNLYGNPA